MSFNKLIIGKLKSTNFKGLSTQRVILKITQILNSFVAYFQDQNMVYFKKFIVIVCLVQVLKQLSSMIVFLLTVKFVRTAHIQVI